MRSIEWLAGLLEGEGCFSGWKGYVKGRYYFQPKISITMTDKDIIDDVASRWGKNIYTRLRPEPKWKTAYEVAQTGIPALETMLAIYPHMGERRRARIEEALSRWEHPRKDLRCA